MLPRPTFIKSPAWRLDLCLKAVRSGSPVENTCEYMRSMYQLLEGGDDYTPNSDLEEAYLMYYLPQSRSILSSLLISGADAPQVSQYIGSSEGSVLYFSKLFFDTSVFPNKLIMKDYIDSLPETNSVEVNYKALMRSGFSLGDRYIAWKMSLNLPEQLLPQDINSDILEDAYWRAREHKPFSIDSNKAKESRSWVPQVLRTLDSIATQQTGGELSVESLRLRLVKTDTTVSIKDMSSEVRG